MITPPPINACPYCGNGPLVKEPLSSTRQRCSACNLISEAGLRPAQARIPRQTPLQVEDVLVDPKAAKSRTVSIYDIEKTGAPSLEINYNIAYAVRERLKDVIDQEKRWGREDQKRRSQRRSKNDPFGTS